MKQVPLILLLCFLMFSCKKNYNCTCTSLNNGINAESNSTISATSKDAQSVCDQKASTVSAGPGSTTTCKIEEE